jgi:hypothetical protein
LTVTSGCGAASPSLARFITAWPIQVVVAQADQLAGDVANGQRAVLAGLGAADRAQRHHRAAGQCFGAQAGVVRFCSDRPRSMSPLSSALTISVVWLVLRSTGVCGASLRQRQGLGQQVHPSEGDADALGLAGAQVGGQAAHAQQVAVQPVHFGEQAVCLRRRVQLAGVRSNSGMQLQLAVLQHLGDGRLRDVQQLGAPADRAGLHDGVEDLDVAQSHWRTTSLKSTLPSGDITKPVTPGAPGCRRWSDDRDPGRSWWKISWACS